MQRWCKRAGRGVRQQGDEGPPRKKRNVAPDNGGALSLMKRFGGAIQLDARRKGTGPRCYIHDRSRSCGQKRWSRLTTSRTGFLRACRARSVEDVNGKKPNRSHLQMSGTRFHIHLLNGNRKKREPVSGRGVLRLRAELQILPEPPQSG